MRAVNGKGAEARLAAIRHASDIAWELCRTSLERFQVECVSCCDMYIWASENDVYVVMRHTDKSLEIAVRGAWEEARPVWDLLLLAHEQQHAILSEYSVPKRPSTSGQSWVPFEPVGTVRIRETSCCGIYEWASQGGIFFVLQRTVDGSLEIGRGQYRFARQEWDRLLQEHRQTHGSMPRKVKARGRGRGECPANKALR